MSRRSLFLQLFGPQVLILLASMTLVALYAWHTGWKVRREERLQVMYAQAELAALVVFQDDGAPKPLDEIERFCRAVRAAEGIRVTVLDSAGHVLVETDAIAGELASHADRPEIREALRAGRGFADRYSATLNKHLFYAARAISRHGRTVGVVRVALPHTALVHDLAQASHGIWLLMVVTSAGAALLSYVVALRVVRPVAAMRASVARIGAGELETRLSLPHLPPLAELAHSINQTTDRLQDELRALAQERNLRERILASMTEGVLATDVRNRVVVINAAACRQLNLGDRQVVGLAVYEWLRRADLLALLDAAADSVVERELLDPAAPETALWARVTPLRDAADVRIGTLVVLNDISHVRRLERVRQEFVANVSHELRTPITAIIGFAETLLEGKVRPDPATSERFLTIIRRQAGQLQSIITDLLLLSRLEDQRGAVSLELTPLAGLVGNAIESSQMQAQAQQVEVRMTIPPAMRVLAHAGLLEQALGNLIQNAIQYGGSGGRVEVSAEELPGHAGVRVQVRDFGPGIAPEHLDRIFERFYRVDKGRSRHQGGTGLGLSIVKHVAQIHQGSVAVASELGKGSVFSIWLPAVEARAEMLPVEPRMHAHARE
jgi:two-component system phosphate regulon sensor histidine kinase PhoR